MRKEIMQAFAQRMSDAFVAGDFGEGNRLLAELMDRQDVMSPPDDARRGNFCFYAGDTEVTDKNGLAFAGIHLGYIVLEHADHIGESLRRRLWEQTLPECLTGYDGHYRASGAGFPGEPMPRWWQCNIWFLTTAGRLMIARALGREDHIAISRDRLREVRRYIELYGMGEYNSPTYLPDQLHGLHWTWYYAPDDAMKADAAALLDELYLDLAEHYHPASGELGGTWSRHYERDIRGRRVFSRYAAAAFHGNEASYLERFGLKDYRCPDEIRKIALEEKPYSVHRRNIIDVRRTMYQTPEYSLGTQSGRFVWYVSDVPLVLTYVTPGDRRVAIIGNPYWSKDVHPAVDYSVDFTRWAHQHENAAILSYGHTGGGNDLLFNLADVEEYVPALLDGEGSRVDAPECPMMPAPPDLEPGRPGNPHRPGRSEDLSFAEPADRDPPGLEVEGPVIAEMPSCYLALIPAADLTLHAAIMRGQMHIVIPVRPAALLAVVVAGKSEYESPRSFAERMKDVRVEEGETPAVARAARLLGWGPTLTAGREPEGRLFERRVDDVPVEANEYLCHSPFYRRRSGERLGNLR
jgi:hypothetical protein